VILLDTNALIWLLAGHGRAAELAQAGGRLYLSPVSLLELQFLVEVDRLEVEAGRSVADVAADPRWQLDSPRSDVLFGNALSVEWTRDPFDRLLIAHARCRRWRLATGDRRILAQLPDNAVLRL
jgi:PIN domain nuclease of toxin-antitoxin system